MNKFVDRSGQVHGMLTLIEPVVHEGKRIKYRCRCDCGEEVIAYTWNIMRGLANSCSPCRAKRAGQNKRRGNRILIVGDEATVEVITKVDQQRVMVTMPSDWAERFIDNNQTVLLWSDSERKACYAYVQEGRKKVMIHRLVAGAPEGLFVDHINGNTLDNSPGNLRIVEKAVNCRNARMNRLNTSGKMGVYFAKRFGKWVAVIGDGKGGKKQLGYFKDFDSAVSAREKAEKELGYHENHGKIRDYFPKNLA